MEFLFDILSKEQDYKQLLKAVTEGRLPIAASGLSNIHKALIIGAVARHTKRFATIIVPDEAAAVGCYEDLKSLGFNAALMPSRDYSLLRHNGFSREYEHKRVYTLSGLSDGAFELLILPLDAAIQYTVPRDILKEHILKFNTGDSVDVTALCDKLTQAGYKRCELCEGVGQFAVRGGIIDIFPTNTKVPFRIELWGDEIDNISEFDVTNQRRSDMVEAISVPPAVELPYSAQSLKEKLEQLLKDKKLTDKARKQLESDLDLLDAGINICPDPYIPVLYDKPACVFDYLPKSNLTFICESGNISDRLKSIEWQNAQDITALLEDGLLLSKTAKLWLTKTELYSHFESGIFLESFPKSSYSLPLKALITFNLKRSTPWSGDTDILLEDIEYITRLKGLVAVLAGEERAAKVLNNELCEKGINSVYLENPKALPESGVFVLKGGLSGGMEIPSLNFLLITHKFILAEKKRHKKLPKGAKSIGSLEELKRGDYVVHAAHGIGIFDGINHITNSGVTKDYIKIKYHGTDILYVPVTQLDLVSKYIGAATEDGNIKLNRLGGAEWQKTRHRVKAAVKDMAKQLTALYAKRMATKGYAFSPDTDLQNNFERRFEYEETEDQLRCINEIKKDMERAVPMDRLLCGDVGFGKTEVALRAAFKCISEGKQCAMLVPTTILAMQHYVTTTRRFGDMPVEVRLLNRFVSKKEQTKTITGLKRGSIDMVIGTHRLISKDVAFKDLGLVIIDEEQRFGVAQKERLKELYPQVDILTLSATPIPRTLNMAMSGLRDMSSIDEAPGDRHPVQTYVLEQNSGILYEAIQKELRRNGQVYYLHNRVESITLCASKIKQMIPDARIGVAHGKMSEDELSEVWQRLVDHEIDILVCTTIIETGVDVPNANTLIIENADRMGLSQLHQLRGRVGRSPRRAYAYLCFSPTKQISEIATKRLEAIREFTEFGSGFRIAMRDLEIRGAGSILGGEQHGNMEAVGYDMYLKLLADAVNEQNGIESHEEATCTVDLNISAHIPESYIESLSARIGIYKRIAEIREETDVSDVLDELCDRFGEPPKSVMGLINISLIRNKAQKSGITEITGTVSSAILHTVSINEQVAEKLGNYFGNDFSISAIGKPKYIIRLKNGKKMLDLVSELAKAL